MRRLVGVKGVLGIVGQNHLKIRVILRCVFWEFVKEEFYLMFVERIYEVGKRKD